NLPRPAPRRRPQLRAPPAVGDGAGVKRRRGASGFASLGLTPQAILCRPHSGAERLMEQTLKCGLCRSRKTRCGLGFAPIASSHGHGCSLPVVREALMREADHRPSPWTPESTTTIRGSSRLDRERIEIWRSRLERGWWVALVGMMLVFSAFPLANLLLGLSIK